MRHLGLEPAHLALELLLASLRRGVGLLPLGLGRSASAPPSRYARHQLSSGERDAMPKSRMTSDFGLPRSTTALAAATFVPKSYVRAPRPSPGKPHSRPPCMSGAIFPQCCGSARAPSRRRLGRAPSRTTEAPSASSPARAFSPKQSLPFLELSFFVQEMGGSSPEEYPYILCNQSFRFRTWVQALLYWARVQKKKG